MQTQADLNRMRVVELEALLAEVKSAWEKSSGENVELICRIAELEARLAPRPDDEALAVLYWQAVWPESNTPPYVRPDHIWPGVTAVRAAVESRALAEIEALQHKEQASAEINGLLQARITELEQRIAELTHSPISAEEMAELAANERGNRHNCWNKWRAFDDSEWGQCARNAATAAEQLVIDRVIAAVRAEREKEIEALQRNLSASMISRDSWIARWEQQVARVTDLKTHIKALQPSHQANPKSDRIKCRLADCESRLDNLELQEDINANHDTD